MLHVDLPVIPFARMLLPTTIRALGYGLVMTVKSLSWKKFWTGFALTKLGSRTSYFCTAPLVRENPMRYCGLGTAIGNLGSGQRTSYQLSKRTKECCLSHQPSARI